MQFIDWLLIVLPILVVVCIGFNAQRYMKSVTDFLSGRRLAGRYLLAVAGGEMQAGAVVFVATFEQISKSGFTLTWWRWLPFPIILILTITGFVGYRYRETRVLTLAQFFEVRYSKAFRLFTGAIGFLAGVANFGIIPAVGARVFVYFLHLPETVQLFSLHIPTYILLMAVFLSITVLMTVTGGIITVMVTDCVEGICSQVFYLIIIAVLLFTFRWSDISSTLTATTPGHSLLNPFDSMGLKDFNLGYVLIGLMTSIYGWGAWQNASGYRCASLGPHEGRMGGLLGNLRELGKLSVVTLLAVCGMTWLQHPHYASQSAVALTNIQSIANPQVQEQMRIPVALSYLLPTGVKGIFCVIMLMGIFGGDSTHLHSWSSIFVQDVLVPLRKKPFTPAGHIRALRLSIIGVALFVFIFGSLYRQTEYIFMWWSVTQAIYIGGAGAAIIGGLYWKKGTTTGAWAAMITGSVLSVGGIIARQVLGDSFPYNGAVISFGAMSIAVIVYAVVSLLTCRENFNLERMLHRGEYAVVNTLLSEQPVPPPPKDGRLSWGRIIGFDESFTLGDKWIAGGLFGWSMFWVVVLIVGSIWNVASPWPASVWSTFWQISGIGIPVLVTIVIGIWFTWGGIRDIRALFHRLATTKINHLDDGTVVDHLNLDEEVLVEQGAIPAGQKKSAQSDSNSKSNVADENCFSTETP